MIVIQNVDVTPRARIERLWVKRVQWVALLVLMVLIYGSHAPLISLTKVDGQVPFSPSSCVIMIEIAKLVISLATLFLNGDAAAVRVPPSLALVFPYAVPALLYALNNNLVVLMQAHMDPSSYQILSNLKIACTALLYSFCLGKRLRPTQCAALGLLMIAGFSHTYVSLDLDDTGLEESSGLHITARGLFLILVYCFVSALAAVYTEWMLKSQKLPLSLQNLYLYVFGVAINGISSAFSVQSEKGFLDGFSGLAWLIIAGQAANGLLMSVVLKHGSGITRLFVISCSMLVNVVLSWAFLGLQLTPFFLIPVCMIGLAAYLYSI
ncbi:putative UDP-sugar transporter protein SLC35A4 [Nelusetta ayraudi]|uniref:putative UDP-sugar transporter protein SLC35A4 n=1 Tax=Nelusetta ayraudi TaxID=303726 RepID=UPI003F70B1C2